MLLDLAMSATAVAFLLAVLKTAPLYRMAAALVVGGTALVCLGHSAPWPRFAVMTVSVAYVGAVMNSISSRQDSKVEIVKRRRVPRL